MKKIINYWFSLREYMLYKRAWYDIKFSSLAAKGYEADEIYKIFKAQKYLKNQGLSKVFILKAKK